MHPAYANLPPLTVTIRGTRMRVKILGYVGFLRKEAYDGTRDVSEIGARHRLGSTKGALRLVFSGASLIARRFALADVYMTAVAPLLPFWVSWKLAFRIEVVHKKTLSFVRVRKDPLYWPDNTYNSTSVRHRRARQVYVAFRNAVMAYS